jgi:hypothetical protein
MSLLERTELLFVTGKGGVGKTTVAIAAAQAAARAGRRVVLCELSGQARAADVYGAGAHPGRELALERGLWALTIDPERALEEWAGAQLHSRRLARLATRSSIFEAVVSAAPGARELLSITKATELVGPRRWTSSLLPYDLVVVDGPASGHGVALLRTPQTFAEIARVGPIASQARTAAQLLGDPRRCAVVAVAQAAELPVSETIELERRIVADVGRPLGAIVVNAVLGRGFSAAELDAVAPADRRVPSGVVAAVRRRHGVAAEQQRQLRRLRRAAQTDVTTLPYIAAPALGLDHLGELAGDLARRL